MPVILVLALLAAAPWTPAAVEHWRADYEAGLKAPGGWLSVAGLFWLHDGANRVGSDALSDVVLPAGTPPHAGTLLVESGRVTFAPASGPARTLKPDSSDAVKFGGVEMTLILRGGKTGARLRNPNAATRRDFTGCKWFPSAERWDVHAKWVSYPEPKKIAILNVLGMTSQEPSPGYAEFTLQGHLLRLEPVIEDNQLFFIFRDRTSGKTTYAAGRFLYADIPKDGTVDLDFNKATNPPCAFTAFATCPLPPKQNTLPLALEAGEKKYGPH